MTATSPARTAPTTMPRRALRASARRRPAYARLVVAIGTVSHESESSRAGPHGRGGVRLAPARRARRGAHRPSVVRSAPGGRSPVVLASVRHPALTASITMTGPTVPPRGDRDDRPDRPARAGQGPACRRARPGSRRQRGRSSAAARTSDDGFRRRSRVAACASSPVSDRSAHPPRRPRAPRIRVRPGANSRQTDRPRRGHRRRRRPGPDRRRRSAVPGEPDRPDARRVEHDAAARQRHQRAEGGGVPAAAVGAADLLGAHDHGAGQRVDQRRFAGARRRPAGRASTLAARATAAVEALCRSSR